MNNTLGYEDRSMIPWSKHRVAAEVFTTVAAILREDVSELNNLQRIYMTELAKQEAHPVLPPDPWTDKAVMYGAILTLCELAKLRFRNTTS